MHPSMISLTSGMATLSKLSGFTPYRKHRGSNQSQSPELLRFLNLGMNLELFVVVLIHISDVSQYNMGYMKPKT